MYRLKNGYIIKDNNLVRQDIYIKDGIIVDYLKDAKEIDCEGLLIMPGLCDIHVHLREPGFTAKETIKTGTKAAAKGGVTSIFAMPNVIPTPDSLKNLAIQEEIIKKDAVVKVYPIASITRGQKGKELSDITFLATKVLAFSDDGVGINDYNLLKEAQLKVKAANRIITSHAEDYNYLPTDPYSESEAVRKEINCLKETFARYHFCHLSTDLSFSYVKKAQALGLNVSCEVTPHHLFLNQDMISNNPNFKMNPPLRSEYDRQKTLAALLDGTASVIATDHAPHTEEEKARDYDKAPNGIIGLETLFPLVYTNIIRKGLASYNKLLDWLVINPRKIMGLSPLSLEPGNIADIACFNIYDVRVYTKEEILSKGKNSPFIGQKLYGFCRYTFVDGKLVYGGENI